MFGVPRAPRSDARRRHRCDPIAVERRHQNAKLRSDLHQARDRPEDRARSIDEPAQQRTPREVDGDLVGHALKLPRKTLDALDEKRRVRDARSLRTPRAARENVSARIDGDRECMRLGHGSVEDVAAVARSHVDEDVAERDG